MLGLSEVSGYLLGGLGTYSLHLKRDYCVSFSQTQCQVLFFEEKLKEKCIVIHDPDLFFCQQSSLIVFLLPGHTGTEEHLAAPEPES